MAIEDSKRVEDVSRRGEVNKYLSLGWVLIGHYIVDRGEPGAPSGEPHFVLAWQRLDSDPVYPERCEKKELEQGK